MIPGHRIAIPFTVWAAAAAVVLAVTDTPMLDPYRAVLPFAVQPVLPVHGSIVALALLVPHMMSPYELRGLVFRGVLAVRFASALIILAAGGWLEPYGVTAALAAAAVGAAAPIRLDGWHSGARRQFGLGVAWIASLAAALYASHSFPDAALAAIVGLSLLKTAAAVARRRVRRVADLPPGYDWRNTPDRDHPGGFMCPCPRHTRVRRSPGVVALCPDCMAMLTKPPGNAPRAMRACLWFARNVIVGKFAYVRETRDPDGCFFCSSASGGLGGRVVPPPDAH